MTRLYETATYEVVQGWREGMPVFGVVRKDGQPHEKGTFRRYYLDTNAALADIKQLAGEEPAPLSEEMRSYYADPDFDPR